MAFENANVVKLTPPILHTGTLSEKIICTRPMRDGKFKIGVEKKGYQTLVHCYGHGGSGWATLFGSANAAIELFEKESISKKHLPIRVVGAGCIGLAIAIELARRGHSVVGITAKELYDIASWRAGGYFALVSIKTDPEEQENMNLFGKRTFEVCKEIEKGRHPYLGKECVRYMPVYASTDTESGMEAMEEMGMVPQRRLVTVDFGNGITHTDFYEYMTYFMDTTLLMKQLHREVKRLQIPLESCYLSSFDQLQEEVVFNCTGMGAQELCLDEKMIPVRGHLVTLSPRAGVAHMDYMIFTKVMQNGKEESLYLISKTSSVSSKNPEGTVCHGVIGGTYISRAEHLPPEDLQSLDEKEFHKLLDRNAQFFYGKRFEELCQSFHSEKRVSS